MEQTTPQTPQQEGTTIVINQVEKKGNGVGTAGFVCALIALIFGWVPVLGWILWLVGTILSIVGMFKQPRGLAIAGTIISLIGIIMLLAVFGALLGAAAMAS